MHGTLVGDFQQFRPGSVIERPFQGKYALDAVDLAFPRLAIRAVRGVDLLVAQ